MQDKTSSHTPIPTELNIAPRGKSWLHGQLIDGEHGHPTRQSMESAESAQPIKAPAAVAVPDAVRDAEKLLRAEAARLERLYSGHGNKWYGFSNEKAAHIEHLRVADALAATPAAPAADAPTAFPAMTEELASILGLMCFQCIRFAQALRAGGYSIEKRAEDEQAAVLHWMLGHYFRNGPDGWRAAASADMERLRESTAKEGGAA